MSDKTKTTAQKLNIAHIEAKSDAGFYRDIHGWDVGHDIDLLLTALRASQAENERLTGDSSHCPSCDLTVDGRDKLSALVFGCCLNDWHAEHRPTEEQLAQRDQEVAHLMQEWQSHGFTFTQARPHRDSAEPMANPIATIANAAPTPEEER